MTAPDRASASRVAKWLADRGRSAEAIDLLCATAAAGANDPEGQGLVAEALRLDPHAAIVKMTFERMEGLTGDHAPLEAAIQKYSPDEVARLHREAFPPSFRRAQVGFNNNVKYKAHTFHVQTEDSGLDKPHIITHLFADGGRVIKSHKRSYAAEVHRADIALYVRALMKGQQMEMLLMLRDGKFDEIVDGRARGGMTVLEGPPNVNVKKVTRRKESSPSVPAVTIAPPASGPGPLIEPGALGRAPHAYCVLHVERSLTGGPPKYEVVEDEALVGIGGSIKIPDPFVHKHEAVLRRRDGKVWVEDLDGGNGVFLRISSRVELADGDEFVVGDQLLRVEKNPPADDDPDPGPTYFYSSPKWPSTFRVVQIMEGGVSGACAITRGGMVQIGSVVGDILIQRDPLVSEQHCLLEEQAGVMVLTDLESRTGVFVRLQGEAELVDGDELLLGRTRLRVELQP